MKRVWQHPEEPKTGKRLWRSIGQLTGQPASQTWLDREFQEGAAVMKDEGELEGSRRTFLKLMSASTAMAGIGLVGCRRPEVYIKPYAKAPEWVIPGKILYYASAMPRPGGGTPLVVNTTEGRPTHLQGNKLHPDSNGGIDSAALSSVLNLYDPDRARDFISAGKVSTRDTFFKFLDAKKKELAGAGGKGLSILTDEVVSPTRTRLLTALQAKYPQARIYRYEAFGPQTVRTVYTKAFGAGVMPCYHLDKADVVFSLDGDFLGNDRVGGSTTGQFMSGRKAEKNTDPMNRLYAVESNYTLTGGMADHRMRVHASQTLKVAVRLAALIAESTKDAALAAAAASVKLTGGYDGGREDYDVWLKLAAEDLASKLGKSVVIAGSQQSEAVLLLTVAINKALNAFGSTVELKQTDLPEAHCGTLEALAKDALAGGVETLLVVGEADPSLEAPADLKWAAVQAAVKNVVVLSTRHRTTLARNATWAVPGTHYLEQWGDTRGFEGTYMIVQPMILPLFGGVSDHELLNALLSNEDTPPYKEASSIPLPAVQVEDAGPGYKLVRDTFNAVVPGASDDLWNFALRDGFVDKTAYTALNAAPNAAAFSGLATVVDVAAPIGLTDVEVTFVPCHKIGDGRYINNAWLQEAPDPVSKVTWDNAALVSVKTAKELGINLSSVDEADVISVQVNGVTRFYPVLVIPGHADYAVTLTVGYGQRGVDADGPGRVGQGTGFDVYGLRTLATPYFATKGTLAKITSAVTTGLDWTDHKEIPAVYPLASTQEHHSMYGRALVREGTQEDWKHDKDFALNQGTDANLHGDRKAKEEENAFSFYKPVGAKKDDGTRTPLLSDDLHQWGMVIDLNRCMGCTACMIACQSENNIPVVGKDQVRRGREMSWIRMDRYFATDLDSDGALNNREVEGHEWSEDEMDNPSMLVQPVGCQHCEAAPCETVCPVNATVHSPDGLNVMVYNRCIGTRYCANNCPFKARRFNFFDYNKRNPLVEKSVGGMKFNNLYAGPLGDRKDTELSKLQKNPNVTVRMRGVIEKCTYCIQRIEGARIDSRVHARKEKSRKEGKYDETLVLDKKELMIPANSLKTACQEACDAEAITFGNLLNDKEDVYKAKRNSRSYDLLGYLSVRARTTYLARIKNPNPLLLAASPREMKKVGQGSKTRPITTAGGAAPTHH
ncbi:MAG: TAT-variant-translocated molybdopterin oxidoreductase [Verrucomicrobiota bacterium]